MKKSLAIAFSLLVSVCAISTANAQVIRYRYSGPLTQQEKIIVPDVYPRVIQRRVLVGAPIPQTQIREPSSEPLLTLRQEKRSNYSKRLADMLEQLTFAYSKGWLTENQFNDLKSWHANVAMEELVLREAGGGIVKLSDVDQLERHMNGLAYTINKQIDEGSKVASSGRGAM